MKFRAKKEDIIIFVMFCIFLLYIIAIGYMNLLTFLNLGKFHGLNPIPAFLGDNLAPTMVFYIASLIMILAGSTSYFFEREKGFGIKEGKKDKGEDRFATDNEVKKMLKKIDATAPPFDSAGIPLKADKNCKNVYVDNSYYHNLIIGSTGSGKTDSCVIPMINIMARKGESIVLTDPKGELYIKTSNMLRQKGYDVVVINLRNPQNGNMWNPLLMPYDLFKNGDEDKSMEILDDLALNILRTEGNSSKDPFWESTAGDYFAALAIGLFKDANPDAINLNSLNYMSTVGEEKHGFNSTYIKEYFKTKDAFSIEYTNASSTIMAPDETKGSILSVFKQKLKLFSSKESLSSMLSKTDFDMKDIGRKKTAVFIVIQDEKKTYHPLATIFLKQCYETLIDVAQENKGELKVRVNFILDEFANMPPLKDVTTMVTAARSRLIRFNFIIQNFAQLNEVYGKENAETIKGNCGNIIYLMSTEIQALEEISKLVGNKKKKDKDGKETGTEPLITIGELQRLKMGDAIVIRQRSYPFKTKLPYYKKYPFMQEEYELADFPVREKTKIELFHLKEFVDNKKSSTLNEIKMDNFGNDFASDFGTKTDNKDLLNKIKEPKKKEIIKSDLSAFDDPNIQKPKKQEIDMPFDIDEFMKNVDKKMQKLEEEEKQALLKKESLEKELEDEKKLLLDKQEKEIKKLEKQKQEELKKQELKEKELIIKQDNIKTESTDIIKDNVTNINTNTSIVNNGIEIITDDYKDYEEDLEIITDDTFYDDFFEDDE